MSPNRKAEHEVLDPASLHQLRASLADAQLTGTAPRPTPSRMLQPGGISSRDWRAPVAGTRVPAHAHTVRTSAPPPQAQGPDASPRTPVGSRVHSGH